MGDFEEKLNTILSSPETMEQIMALASSLSGGGGGGETAAPPSPPENGGGAPDFGGLGGLFSGIDPAMLMKLMPLVQEYQTGSSEKQALLNAMKPFLRPESQAKMDKAIQITRLSHVIRSSMKLFGRDGHV